MSTPIDINDVEPRREYTAVASQTSFAVPFEFFSDSDLVVYRDGVLATLNVDYTVTGAETENGGTITWIGTAMAGGETIIIKTDIPIARDTQYVHSGNLPHDVLERDFAKSYRINQQLEVAIKRAMKLPDDETYVDMTLPSLTARMNKYLSFGAAGEPLAADAISATTTLDRSTIGGHLFPRTDAEIDAGVTPTYYYYDPKVDPILRYDGDPTYTTDSRQAFQDAINVNSHASEGDMGKINVSKGHYQIGGVLYGYHHNTLNAGFKDDVRAQGRFHMIGGGRGQYQNAINADNATIVQFDAGQNFKVANIDHTRIEYVSTTAHSRSVVIEGMVFIGNFDGSSNEGLLDIDGCSNSSFKDFVVYNSHTDGIGIRGHGVFESDFTNLLCTGVTGGTSRGLWLDQTTSLSGGSGNPVTGGNIMLDNVTGRNCEVGLDFGRAYNASNTRDYNNVTLMRCQAKDNVIGIRFRHGIESAVMIQPWLEGNTGNNVVATDSAFKDESLGRNGLLHWIGGDGGSGSGAAAQFESVQLGDTGGTNAEDAIGHVLLDGVRFDMANDTVGIRRYNNADNGFLKLRDPIGVRSGSLIWLVDEAQHGSTIIENTEGLEIGSDRWIVDDWDQSTNNNIGHWAIFEDCGSGYMPGLGTTSGGSPDYNFADAWAMSPAMSTSVASPNTQTIALPVDKGAFTTLLHSTADGIITFDAGARTINGGGSTLSVEGDDVTFLIMGRASGSAVNYHISVLPKQEPYLADATVGSAAEINAIRDALVNTGVMKAS